MRIVPITPKNIATVASRLLHRNQSKAETKTTRKPGISRGNSRKDRSNPLRANRSLRKLLNVDSIIL
jgi:hypothetical protein